MVRRATLALFATASASVLAPAALGDGRCGSQPCHADVDVSGHSEPQPIRLNETSSIKVTAKNDGYDGALKIDLHVDVPKQLRILSVKNYGGFGCKLKGTFVRCDLGDFAREQEAVVRIKVRGKRVGTWISQAKVYATDVNDTNQGNNHVEMTTMVKSREQN
jgi:hypothetical protein